MSTDGTLQASPQAASCGTVTIETGDAAPDGELFGLPRNVVLGGTAALLTGAVIYSDRKKRGGR